MNNIHMVVVMHSLAEPVVKLMEELLIPDITLHLFTHSMKTPVTIAAEKIRDSHRRGAVRLYPYGTNRGLALSFNEGILNARNEKAETILIANDDITAKREDITKIIDFALANQDVGFVEAIGYDERMARKQNMNLALCAVNNIVFDTIGYYDVNFLKIYFEDSDFNRRAALAGIKWGNVGETSIVHTSMATTQLDPQLLADHARNFSANEAYYVQKWGGIPSEEKYEIPFNDPRYTLNISATQAFSPYLFHNRVGNGSTFSRGSDQ